MDNTKLIKTLYQAVDNKSLTALADFLADNVRFQIGNYAAITGKNAVLDANHSFFSSITSMAHQITSIWESGDDVLCNGHVDYTRLDGSGLSIPFATVLKIDADKIVDYQVYVDVSPL
ncbi:nuclear transport factor 2 family protein [Shewanella salipaludis]|uniref:Nuclear transport factor 2 family protein n=1 Tax=Shewanella salipaludis TaxID=2723052 RepID=A0A972FWF9_9GAMM|nr:nuclear transport factor 2 family protein [Shewanella salipaludis]NMH66514.1 nuclear transport factor 2 family protein [Shewanella salipaludis]